MVGAGQLPETVAQFGANFHIHVVGEIPLLPEIICKRPNFLATECTSRLLKEMAPSPSLWPVAPWRPLSASVSTAVWMSVVWAGFFHS